MQQIPRGCAAHRADDVPHAWRTPRQPAFPIYPESAHKFFYKVVNAQITFVSDSTGKVTKLILHQNGRELPAQRVK